MVKTSLSDLKLLQLIRQHIFDSDTYQKMCSKSNLDPNIIFYSPMAFADLDVSARTQHGIIYFNSKLKNNPQEIDHYMVHEFTHVIQQCFGDEPTQGSNDSDDYLENPFEVEGFNYQTAYIAEDEGPEEAEQYIERVLDHHDVPESKKDKKKLSLLDSSLIDDEDFNFDERDFKEDDFIPEYEDFPLLKRHIPYESQKSSKTIDKSQLPLFDEEEIERLKAIRDFRKKIIDTNPVDILSFRPTINSSSARITPHKLSEKSKRDITDNVKNIQNNIEKIILNKKY